MAPPRLLRLGFPISRRCKVSAFKPQQRHLTIRDHEFHFVAYEAREANKHRGEEASPAMWYLMREGRRWPAIPLDTTQPSASVDASLLQWAEAQAIAAPVAVPRPARKVTTRREPTGWWGPE